MQFKLVLAVLAMTFIATKANYVVVNTWADQYCNTTLISKFVTNNDAYCPLKRATSAAGSKCEGQNIGVFYTIDYSYCTSEEEPAFPGGWQVVRWGNSKTCSLTNTIYDALGAARLEYTWVAMLTNGSPFASTVTLWCKDNVFSFTKCNVASCEVFTTLDRGVCTGDEVFNTTFATQTTCVTTPIAAPLTAPVAPPVSAPFSAPIASVPIAAPIADSTPVSAPVIDNTPVYTNTPVIGSSPDSTPESTPVIGSTPEGEPVSETTPVSTNTPVIGSSPESTPVIVSTPVSTPIRASAPVNAPVVGSSPVRTPIIAPAKAPIEDSSTVSGATTHGVFEVVFIASIVAIIALLLN